MSQPQKNTPDVSDAIPVTPPLTSKIRNDATASIPSPALPLPQKTSFESTWAPAERTTPPTQPPHTIPLTPSLRPSAAYTTTTWVALAASIGAYTLGLFNAATLTTPEKLLLLFTLLLSLFSTVSLQKAIRDQLEGIPTSDAFRNISRIALIMSLVGGAYGTFNLDLTLAEKGFYCITNLFALFAAVSTQKNQRDIQAFNTLFPSK